MWSFKFNRCVNGITAIWDWSFIFIEVLRWSEIFFFFVVGGDRIEYPHSDDLIIFPHAMALPHHMFHRNDIHTLKYLSLFKYLLFFATLE